MQPVKRVGPTAPRRTRTSRHWVCEDLVGLDAAPCLTDAAERAEAVRSEMAILGGDLHPRRGAFSPTLTTGTPAPRSSVI